MSHQPIEPVYLDKMNALARELDVRFNGIRFGSAPPHTGFVLLVFPFGHAEGQRTNYISNAERADIIVLLKEMVARFEGQPEVSGRA